MKHPTGGTVDPRTLVLIRRARGGDEQAWSDFQSIMGQRIQIIGDDLFTTSVPRIEHGIKTSQANAALIKPSEMAAWIRAADLVLEDMTGLVYNPLTRQFRLSPKDVSVNYMVRAARPA